jgi:glycosyltransferase involved in cell wall biosynthesis
VTSRVKLLFHSNAPWVGTGYGQQTALFVPRLAGLGHEVVISAFYGIDGNTTAWDRFLVLPKGQDNYGSDILAEHLVNTGCEALITLMDAWVLDRGVLRQIRDDLKVPVCHWMPVDVARLGAADLDHLQQAGSTPIAMSRHGKRALEAAGVPVVHYVPHGVDTNIFRPPQDREALRASFNTAGRFTVGINSANKGTPSRKNFAGQLEAFKIFRETRPEANALLLLHTWRTAPGGENLDRMAQRKGIPPDSYSFSHQYRYTIGQITPQLLGDWYGSLDVLLNCSWGEGFGIPVIESLAAGTPVIVNDATAMTELCGAGWKVPGDPYWNEFHGEDWQTPHVRGIVRALEKAYELYRDNDRDGGMDALRVKARKFALKYDADRVRDLYWKPVLAAIGGDRERLLAIGGQRDAAVARLSRAWSAGSLDAEAFGERARAALAAARAEDLAGLVADLPEEAAA